MLIYRQAKGGVTISSLSYKRVPRHIGVIPDGNRRWAEGQGLPKHAGYQHGLGPGMQLYDLCLNAGIEELTFYGFTQDNTKRPARQKQAFQQACVDAVKMLSNRDASLLVIGDDSSPLFPPELKPYRVRQTFGSDAIRINFLVNYGWNWDLTYSLQDNEMAGNFHQRIASADISRIDLIIRWGNRRRLSGFLPVQSVYSDFYIIDSMWPDFQPEHFHQALDWYQEQDVTLGG